MRGTKKAKQAWDDWITGKIDGNERDKITKPYLAKLGIDGTNPYEADSFIAAQKAATNEQELRQAYMLRDAINEKEKTIASRLEPGTRQIYMTGIGKVEAGKRSVASLDKAIQSYRDSTEKQVRQSIENRSNRESSAVPGIEWNGGRLAAGSTKGETMDPSLAAFSIVDKYHRSSMPANGIVPNLSVSGMNTDGEVVTGKVPEEIVRRLYEQSISGIQPDPTELAEWLDEWVSENDIYDNEVDLFGDDSDSPIS